MTFATFAARPMTWTTTLKGHAITDIATHTTLTLNKAKGQRCKLQEVHKILEIEKINLRLAIQKELQFGNTE